MALDRHASSSGHAAAVDHRNQIWPPSLSATSMREAPASIALSTNSGPPLPGVR
jgi:hypothetical protein